MSVITNVNSLMGVNNLLSPTSQADSIESSTNIINGVMNGLKGEYQHYLNDSSAIVGGISKSPNINPSNMLKVQATLQDFSNNVLVASKVASGVNRSIDTLTKMQ